MKPIFSLLILAAFASNLSAVAFADGGEDPRVAKCKDDASKIALQALMLSMEDTPYMSPSSASSKDDAFIKGRIVGGATTYGNIVLATLQDMCVTKYVLIDELKNSKK